MPKPAPQHLINREEAAKTEARLLQTPADKAWKRIGVRNHYGLCIPLFGAKTQESGGIGEFMDLIPLGMF